MVMQVFGVFGMQFSIRSKRSEMKALGHIILTILFMGMCVIGCSQDSGKSVDAFECGSIESCTSRSA